MIKIIIKTIEKPNVNNSFFCWNGVLSYHFNKELVLFAYANLKEWFFFHSFYTFMSMSDGGFDQQTVQATIISYDNDILDVVWFEQDKQTIQNWNEGNNIKPYTHFRSGQCLNEKKTSDWFRNIFRNQM